MNESPNKRAVTVGLFVFLGIAFLITGILLVGSQSGTFKKKMRVTSFFDDVNGLQTGNNVWFSGVKIGTVGKIHFHGKSQVEVSVNIEVKAQEYIRKDAKIKISTDGLIGNKILVIYDGTPKFAEVQEGDTLEVEKTFSSEDMINMLQENNKNLLAITTDFSIISKSLAAGEGTIGKLLMENDLYENINGTMISLHKASAQANRLVSNLNTFSEGLSKKGTLVSESTTDTIVFNSMRKSVLQLQQMADTATVFIANLKEAGSNPNTSVGVLLHDEGAGTDLKSTIENLESSSQKLDENLEALQHNFLLRRYFKKKKKEEEKTIVDRDN